MTGSNRHQHGLCLRSMVPLTYARDTFAHETGRSMRRLRGCIRDGSYRRGVPINGGSASPPDASTSWRRPSCACRTLRQSSLKWITMPVPWSKPSSPARVLSSAGARCSLKSKPMFANRPARLIGLRPLNSRDRRVPSIVQVSQNRVQAKPNWRPLGQIPSNRWCLSYNRTSTHFWSTQNWHVSITAVSVFWSPAEPDSSART
jgi:hypothetical protein